jgi:uncharacterized phage-associated protein
MARVDDVAAAILEQSGPLDPWKLQKLVFYAQAWHLAWERKQLFRARIEAWAAGPAIPKLYARHRGRYTLTDWPLGRASALNRDEQSTLEAVLKTYGPLSPEDLSAVTRREPPWIQARIGLSVLERGHRVIEPAALTAYYAELA